MSPCPVCQRGRILHAECSLAAVEWYAHQRYDIEAVPDLVRRLGPVCYLCGAAASEHAEHVYPRSRGGTDRWSNRAGACQSCNRAKHARVPALSRQQALRFREQQAAYRAAYDRVDADLVARHVESHLEITDTETHPIDLDELAELATDQLEDLTEAPYTVAVADGYVEVRFTDTGATLHLRSVLHRPAGLFPEQSCRLGDLILTVITRS